MKREREARCRLCAAQLPNPALDGAVCNHCIAKQIEKDRKNRRENPSHNMPPHSSK